MAREHSWPVRVSAAGPVTVGTSLWRYEGQLSVTAIVKATFVMTPDDEMTVTAPEPLRVTEEIKDGAPLGSLCGMRETVPMLQEAEVVLFGQAHAPRHRGSRSRSAVTEATVRMSIGRGERLLLEKTLQIVGDRDRHGPPTPFEQMPITYERALGGAGFSANPLGVGRHGSSEQAPNVLDVDDPEQRVGGFGPIPQFFGARSQLRGHLSEEEIEAEVAELAANFDWAYFNAAPTDQRVPAFHGNEWVELVGLSPLHARLRSSFPQARGLAQIYGHEHANVPNAVPLRADLLIIEPDEHHCSLVWRGSFPIAEQRLTDEIVIAGGLELPGRPVLWPAHFEEAIVLSAPPPKASVSPPRDPEAGVRTAVYQGRRGAEPGAHAVSAQDDAGEEGPRVVKTTLLDSDTVDEIDQLVREAQAARAKKTAQLAAIDPEPPRRVPSTLVEQRSAEAPFAHAPSYVGEPPVEDDDPEEDLETDLLRQAEPIEDDDSDEDLETDLQQPGLPDEDDDPDEDLETDLQQPGQLDEDPDPDENVETDLLKPGLPADDADPDEDLETAVQGAVQPDRRGSSE